VVGKIIAKKYRVEQQIGEGGMGKVYKATQLALDKPVVLKVLHSTLLSDDRTVQRFQREAKAASRLNHPNSINVLDFGQAEDKSMYIAMEFVSGKDLHHTLTKEWPLAEARVVKIVNQVLSALADAHGAGVIHRDLKPENIMLEQRRNDPDFVKVLDFGIAKIQDSTGEEGPALTRAGFVCGTPEYMSPEQARGGVIDQRSDLYAVGVILYQLVTGRLPFESDSAVGFATKHLTEEPLPPTQKRPEAKVSPGMEQLIMRSLAKDPNDRPQDAEQFRAELNSLDNVRKITGPIPLKQGKAKTEKVVTGSIRRGNAPEDAATQVNQTWPEEGAAARDSGLGTVFKVATVGLVLGAVGIVGYVFYDVGQPPPPPPQVIVGAPVPQPALQLGSKLYETEIPKESRDADAASKLSRAGDDAHQRGELKLAATRYQEAFQKNPDPELSLKLGEVYYQLDDAEGAKGWWKRHLKDRDQSAARTYIKSIYRDL